MGSVFDDAIDQVATNETVIDNEEDKSKAVSEENEIVSEKVDDQTVSEKETQVVVCDEEKTLTRNPTIIFVLGGPGGGKSTQCSNLAKETGYTHLSSGDLIRKAMESDPVNGPMMQSMMKEGKSIPPCVTMILLLEAIDESGNDKFLLDGFPRDEEIRAAFEEATKIEPERVLFFDCSEEERERRILSRNQGRVDDNPDSLRKRFKYFEEHTLPVVEYYSSKGKVSKIDAGKPIDEVFGTLKSLLMPASRVQPEEEKPAEEEKYVTICGLEKDILTMKV